MESQEKQMEVQRLVDLIGKEWLEVKRSKENSVDAHNFLARWVLCSYDDERIGNIKVPFRYKYLVKQWVPKKLPPFDTKFYADKRMYCIAPSSLHGLGIFSMDGIKVKYKGLSKIMEYVKWCYNYKD